MIAEGVWKKIKSGSDIRGVASDTVKGEEVTLTNEVIDKIALAFAVWVSKKTNLEYSSITMALGHDSRESALRIKNVIINSLRGLGINVYDCSLTSTPAMFMATSVLSCTASIEITASHHPANRNGLKFFTASGGLSEEDIDDILDIAQSENEFNLNKRGNVRSVDLMQHYCEKLKNLIIEKINSQKNHERPLSGLKIVVDAGNGAGGFFVKDVLIPLGANTKGSKFLNPDGKFPHHIPNPEEPNAIKSIVDAVKENSADLGIIFDTDVDRVAFVDSSGKEISGNKLIALASKMVLEENSNSIIVTDSVTSDYLKDFIEKLGGTQFRYKRGYHNVITMSKTINEKGENCPLAIETSGHAAFKENKFIDDGAYFACKIIAQLVKLKDKNQNLNEYLKDFVNAKEKISIRFPIKAEEGNVNNVGVKILNSFKNYCSNNKNIILEKDNIEGVRVTFKFKHQKGWMLLRKSVHDPVLILYAESYIPNNLRSMFKLINPFFTKQQSELDISDIKKFF